MRIWLENANAAVGRTDDVVSTKAEVHLSFAFAEEKAYRGLLDYDDLIDKTLDLLTAVDPSWVHYKLDLGLDHVLVDEAQDISKKQWEIVKRLTSEFAAGAGARGTPPRTVFAVGDEKQSIFSFQGAAPQEYEAARRHFAAAYETGDVGWRFVRFDHSFRRGVIFWVPSMTCSACPTSIAASLSIATASRCTWRCPMRHRGWWTSGR